MKLLLHSGDLDEIRHEQQRGVIAGVTVDLTRRPGWDDRQWRGFIAAIAASGVGSVSVAVQATTLDAMVREAEELSALAPTVIVALGATPDGRAAIRRCAARGIATQVVGCRSPADVELAARAGARCIGPALVAGSGDGSVLDAARMTRSTLRAYARATEVLVGPMVRGGQVWEAALGGADAASVVFPVVQQLLALGCVGTGGSAASTLAPARI